MNKIVDDYIDGRIEAAEQYRKTFGDKKVDGLISVFEQIRPMLDDVSNEKELKEAKKEIKDSLLGAINVASIEDEKKRALTIQTVYNLVDYHFDNVNSRKAIKEFSKDMGMSVREYLAFAFKLALDMSKEERGNSRTL